MRKHSLRFERSCSALVSFYPVDFLDTHLAQAPERDGLIVSRLYPVKVVLDVPQPATQAGGSGSNSPAAQFEVRDIIRVVAIAAAVGLAGYIVYRRIKRKPIQS